MRNPLAFASIAVALAFGIAGCGGGGGSTSDGGAVPVPDAVAPQPAALGDAPAATGPATAARPALSWTQPAGQAAAAWHWTATNPSGSLMVATAIPGGVYLSRDQGASWVPQTALPQGPTIWIASAMSDDGRVVVAVALNGGMYRSVDGGASWSRIDAAFNPAEDLDYESVAVSADGARIVAAVMGGSLWTSADGTAATPTFTQASAAGGGTLAGWWRAVASDASGMRVVAASHNGDVWLSDDGGATFAPLDVSVAGGAVHDGWYRLALSRDGTTLALAGNEEYGIGVPAGSRSSGLYVGHYAAGRWTFGRASGVAGNYTRVTIAASAPVIAATLSGPSGGVLLSADNGATFSPLPTPAGDTAWRSIALTGDAGQAVLAAGTFFGDPGHLFVSSGALVP
ncbi:MAG: WD40/YVTN/BNR-like repeat-containing protein [Ramlibacter sp.]